VGAIAAARDHSAGGGPVPGFGDAAGAGSERAFSGDDGCCLWAGDSGVCRGGLVGGLYGLAPGREETWIDPTVVAIFEALHRAGLAHSVEAWVRGEGEERLVGGLYGLALGRVFCGESMFSRPAEGGTDASKVCLVKLVEHLRGRGFRVLDAQLSNPHLVQFGLYEVSGFRYRRWLEEWADQSAEWLPWTG